MRASPFRRMRSRRRLAAMSRPTDVPFNLFEGTVTVGGNLQIQIEEVRFAMDSPLEGEGFEPSVPV
jgi:hypothetical protein